MAVVVDDLGLSFESTVGVRNSLKKFIDKQVKHGDQVAILRTAGGVGAAQFTADRRLMHAAAIYSVDGAQSLRRHGVHAHLARGRAWSADGLGEWDGRGEQRG